MAKTVIKTSRAPLPIGSYSQATKAGRWLFVSGIGAEDPDTGDVITGNVEKQIRQCVKNVRTVLEAANLTLDDVVKITVYLKNIRDWSKMNRTLGEYFKRNPPARTTVEAKMALEDMLVQIEAIAFG